ncbi:immunoglobulin-like domain-containing protein [Falsibacillus pallidus]|uniref:Bacterial Ig-like domain-containing protein n=1 Tax=Falsibacillus pallidus TaxID=493781 RepID=A0A370GAD9_9BACI|nr:immunoglobulin-like domain-containing protein [Falsibacillus pallidus]RDI40146.1 hypothetical protein DFR59_11262 [Falsibacillus pallidus]
MFKRIAAIVILLGVLGGCESPQNGSVKAGQGAEPINDIPAQAEPINHAKVDQSIKYYSKSYIQSLDDLFIKSGLGEVGMGGLDRGTAHPLYDLLKEGESVKIDVPRLIKEGYTYDTFLYHYNVDKKEFELVKKMVLDNTKHRYSYFKLSNNQNQIYYIKNVLINPEKKEVQKTYRRIFVLYDIKNARIDVDQKVYYPLDTVKVKLTNLGTQDLLTGLGVYLEKWRDGKWQSYKYQQAVADVGIVLPPGVSHTNTIPVKALTPGYYRVTDQSDTKRIAATFQVSVIKTME